jgi:hypothetical protein
VMPIFSRRKPGPVVNGIQSLGGKTTTVQPSSSPSPAYPSSPAGKSR